MAETIEVRQGEDFNLTAVERCIREHIEGLPEEELEVKQFPSGASNLTYLVRIGDWEGVLRRPPLGPVPPKAHDMGRESKILMKLHGAYPLAPRPYFFTDDESIIGAPFYVMERRKGVVVDNSFPEGVEPTEELYRGISRMAVDTLVKLHAVDWREAGLGEFGRPEGFLERQVKGWIGRYDKAKTEEIKEVGPLTEWISRDIPESPPATIVHNDYKLNNLVLNPDDLTEVRPTVASTPGFMTRKEFIDYYAEKSGRNLSAMHWYMVFGYFKLAVILQQIYARWHKGQTKDERFANFNERVRNVIIHAHELAQKGDL